MLLLAMIKGVYPVGHRNERRKVSGIVTARIGMHVFAARPSASPDGLLLSFSVLNGLTAGKAPPSLKPSLVRWRPSAGPVEQQIRHVA